MTSTLKNNWYKNLKKQEHGWLLYPNGNKSLVHLHLHKYDCYMSSGIKVSQDMNLNQPTMVLMEYEKSDNRFKVTITPNQYHNATTVDIKPPISRYNLSLSKLDKTFNK
jgi:hypothetical protein